MSDYKKIQIEIPEGISFTNNCCDCRYADWSDKDSYGRVYCNHGYGYNKPSNRNGCFGYVEER